MLTHLVALLRPKQWAKNLLVFAAWVFAGRYTDPDAGRQVLIAFAAMCLASSAVYVWNDVLDVERDRAHPKKKTRPIASGAVPVAMAVGLGIGLAVAGAGLAASLNRTSLVLVLAYFVLQGLYNWRVKAVPVLDVFFIATGFVMRAVLGATALGVTISAWLLFCTGSLALMLGFAKRRNEFVTMGEARTQSRESLASYTRPALDAFVVIFAAGAAMCYGVYSIESKTAQAHPAMLVSAPLVLYGISRYLLLVFRFDEGGEPADVLFRDPHIWGSVILFIATAGLAISGFRIPFLEP